MPLFRVQEDRLEAVAATSFMAERVLERRDLQRLIRADASVIDPDLMVICDEYGDWEDSARRLDLLCLDRQARLVVVELKRTDDGGHMELQAIRYAAMISSMTVDQLVHAHSRYLGGDDSYQRAAAAISSFLNWENIDEGAISDEIRIILLAGDFSIELTTAVLWLNKNGLDITCIRLKPYKLDQQLLIDVQQIIPLPEAADYETKIRSQKQEARRVEAARLSILRRFWAQIIERSKPHTKLYANRTVSSVHWLSGRVGRTGFELNFTLAQDSSRVECMIDLGKGSDALNLKAFNALLAQKSEIESAFGAPLDWQELPESRACRICQTLAGGWKTPEQEWPELQDRLIAAMVRLEKAIKPPILALKIDANDGE